MRVNHGSRVGSLQVSADRGGLVSRSGSALVGEVAARLGLERELSRGLGHVFRRRPLHDPGRVVVDLATMLIDGGDCVSDLGALAEQPDLFGQVASPSTASRLLMALSGRELAAVRSARRAARGRAWALGARPGTITLDFDAQLLECHSEKEGAGPHRKGGFGFHPLHCFCDETGEHLAAVLRPGNAGANTAVDHVSVLEAALAQLPDEVADRERAEPVQMLARSDSAGASHVFAAALRERKIRFSLGYYVDERVGQAALALPPERWLPALDRGEQARQGAWVAELTDQLDLSGWPQGTRLIVRKERPHPGAQLRFTDADGHRFQCFLTDQDGEIGQLERRHRLHARVEDRIQESQELGLGRLPFQALQANEAWFELALLAQDLLAWLRLLVLEGDLALAKPKRLRHRLLHVAGRITRSGRRRTLHLPQAWPWHQQLLDAYTRVAALTPG